MTHPGVFMNTLRSMAAHRGLLALLAALALWTAATAAALAAPGELDSSFGGDGRVLVDFGGVDNGRSVALQPDGKIVMAGYSNAAGTNDFAVARLGPGGLLDGTFGSAGGRQLVGFGGNVDFGWALALQPDGKVVVAGSSNTGGDNNFALTRLGSNGLPDGSFGNAGLAGVDLGGNDVSRAVALQADGKVYAVGHSSAGANPYNFAIARFGANGVLDQSFNGPSGWTLVDFQTSTDFTGSAALQQDGKLLVAGYNAPGGAGNNFEIARLNSDSLLDTSFAGDGTAAVDFGGIEGNGALALQRDGKVIVAGSSNAGGDEDFAITRLDSNGSLDTSFAGDGKAVVDFGAADVGQAAVMQPDGKILVAGYTVKGGNYAFAVARLQPNGLADTTFAKEGKAVVDFGGEDIAWGLALQPDGKIVLAGHTNADNNFNFALARLQGDPGGAVGGGGGPGTDPGSDGTPPRCAGRLATIVGTPAADRLRGTSRRDVIVSLGGRDVIRSLSGNDIVCAGSGNDTVFGGRGNDRLGGGSGNDRLLGESGRDRLVGESGRDRLRGGPGRDRLLGGPGRDAQRQ
jgi:uncharacterized delta-60 repeat protein